MLNKGHQEKIPKTPLNLGTPNIEIFWHQKAIIKPQRQNNQTTTREKNPDEGTILTVIP